MGSKEEKAAGHIETYVKTMPGVISDCRDWAREIGRTYSPDLIVFVAKSGFLFAKPMAEYFKCDMAGILASRPSNGIKDKLKLVIGLMPQKAILALLKQPWMYRWNDRNRERNVETSVSFEREKAKRHRKILIVDDSVDTGWTLKRVCHTVRESFPDAMIKTAGYSMISYSEKRICVDFYRYRNAIVLTATSRKSEQYPVFLEEYEKWMSEKE